jgi:hypothetical protein
VDKKFPGVGDAIDKVRDVYDGASSVVDGAEMAQKALGAAKGALEQKEEEFIELSAFSKLKKCARNDAAQRSTFKLAARRSHVLALAHRMGRDAVASINGTDTPLWQLPREEYEAGVRNASVMFFPFVREMLRSYLVRTRPDRCSWGHRRYLCDCAAPLRLARRRPCGPAE